MAAIDRDGPSTPRPDDVRSLEAAYGPPSDAAFGSAVFFRQIGASDELESSAKTVYRAFVGKLWDRYGEDAWMGKWRRVYDRGTGTTHGIVAELRSIEDRNASQSVPMLLDGVDDGGSARAALAAAYDDPAVTELSVFTIGDGEAMSGLLVAGRRPQSGETTFLVFLMD